jgi:hypothetical protein
VAFKQEVNVPLIVTVGIVSAIIVVVLIVGTQAWYQSEEQMEMAAKEIEFPNQKLIDMKAAQKANIERYVWVDMANGVITIPVEDAMTIMIDNKGKFPASRPSGQ